MIGCSHFLQLLQRTFVLAGFRKSSILITKCLP
ncbi:unnamed protein product [Linum tenue]|uniref:Uncharacterized protein n=1 Tax=Linum tenue TaxID=586396 RepID=A0AAV0IIF1_9ROSI|nr:unnamed protein product [Linum tenue]